MFCVLEYFDSVQADSSAKNGQQSSDGTNDELNLSRPENLPWEIFNVTSNDKDVLTDIVASLGIL